MGRIDTSDEPQFVHEGGDAPPPMEEDLYESAPPPHYPPPPPPPPSSTNQRSTPPPQSFPPPQHPAAHVHHFPPPQDPHPSNAHHFPPPQDHHPASVHHFPPPPDKPPMGQPFTPSPPPQQQHFLSNFATANPYIHHQQQPQNFQQGIPMGLQQNQLPTQPWSSDLFDCMNNPQNALITLFFPCVTFGQIAEIVDSGSTSCGTSGMLYSLIAFCIAMPCIMSCTYRTKLRSKYGLIESPAPDWVIHCFCECCALCQEYRELEQKGFDPSIGWMGNVAKQKQQQFGMTPPMQQRMF